MNHLVELIYLALILIISAVVFIIFKSPSKNQVQKEKNNVAFCGTISPYDSQVWRHNSNPNISPEIGKNIFKRNCATCHSKDMKTNATGPALGGAFKSWENDTTQYSMYLSGQLNLLNDENSSRISILREEYKLMTTPHEFHLSREEIASLLIYIDFLQ